ncbi:MAG: hypothetical protein ACTSYA_01465 [Candidatus Kariarchaeaceae archaeon]
MSIEEVIKAAVMTDPKTQVEKIEIDMTQHLQNKERIMVEKTKRQHEQKEFLNRLFMVVESYFRHF